MTEINLSKNIYLYGKFYDSNLEDFPNPESEYDIIIYLGISDPKNEKRKIGSLEGIFISHESVLKNLDGSGKFGNLLLRRDQMEQFEKKYLGKFVHFGK